MWSRWTVQRKMAEEDVQRCLQWIAQQQKELETFPSGTGQDDVTNALANQKEVHSNLENNKATIDRVVQKHRLDNGPVGEVYAAYDAVRNISYKRGSCLGTLNGIVSLEQPINEMVHAFDVQAVHLVAMGENNKMTSPCRVSNQSNASMARSAQNCMLAVRRSWQWINTVLQCAQVHLYNAAAYHQFFHEVEEAEYWMTNTLSRMHTTFDRSKLTGDRADAEIMQEEIKDVLLAYLQWQTKIDSLFDRSKNIVPVARRVEVSLEPRPVLALTDYTTKEMEFKEGDTLTLLDNSDANKWKVRNDKGQVSLVPAVILLVPAPSGLAVDAANRLRAQLLSLWTVSVKRLGHHLITFLTFIFREWNEEEANAMEYMPEEDKRALLRAIGNIRATLQSPWSECEEYKHLEERMALLEKHLQRPSDSKAMGEPMRPTAVVQIQTLDTLLNKYRDFWDYWQTFKVAVDVSRQPKLLLVCDKWEDLRFLSTAHVVKFWDTNVDVDKGKTTPMDVDKPDGRPANFSTASLQETPREKLPAPTYKLPVEEKIQSDSTTIVESMITKTTTTTNESAKEEEEEEGEEYDVIEEETVTESVESSVQEVRQTFIITGILDPHTNEYITLEQAVVKGLVNPMERVFIHPDTGRKMTVPEATNEGFIRMEVKSRETTRLENKSYGMVTIKTMKDNRPYVIKNVIHPRTEEELTVQEAERLGIVDLKKGTYRTESHETLSLRDAISSGLISVEFSEAEGAEHNGEAKEEVVKTYAVYGVVNQRRKCQVPFRDAVNLGLLDRDHGTYYHNVNRVSIPISEAIMKGFIKARLVTDPSKLDVDPSDNIVVDRLKTARSKILGAVRTARAFKENN